jgi:hypothetical protein
VVLTSTISAGGLQDQDWPDIILSVLLLGLDPTTPQHLRRHVTATINSLCVSIGESDLVRNEIVSVAAFDYMICHSDERSRQESALCSKVLVLATPLSPANKAFLVSFFSGGGSPRTIRLARCIAYGLITGSKSTSPVSTLTFLKYNCLDIAAV